MRGSQARHHANSVGWNFQTAVIAMSHWRSKVKNCAGRSSEGVANTKTGDEMGAVAIGAAHQPRLEEPAQNRSLERGIDILRCFRPGTDLMGNGELAERTGLSKATVSRLTQTLVGSGMLEYDARERAYRLAAPVLSLAHAMRSGSPVLQVAAPLMRSLAEKLRINVGLAAADRDEMVYLESVRYHRKVSLRSVTTGQRVPIELTSLGRAYLAALDEEKRDALLGKMKTRRGKEWPRLATEISAAVKSVERHGFCAAAWQPEVVAVATPIATPLHPIYVLNVSVSTTTPLDEVVPTLKGPLLQLAHELQARISSL